MSQQTLDDSYTGNVVAQDEILVRNLGRIAQAHDRRACACVLHINLVRRRTQILNGHAGIERHRDGDVVSGARAGRRDRRRDLRSIGNFVRIRSRASALMSNGCGSRNVARSNHHRKNKLITAIFVFEPHNVTEGHVHSLARRNVSDRLRKNVGPLLVKQSRYFALLNGFGVKRSGLFAALDHSANGACPNLNGHIVYCGIRGQRESIDRLDLFRRWVLKILRHFDARHEAADAGSDIGMAEGTNARDLSCIENLQRAIGDAGIHHGDTRAALLRQAQEIRPEFGFRQNH